MLFISTNMNLVRQLLTHARYSFYCFFFLLLLFFHSAEAQTRGAQITMSLVRLQQCYLLYKAILLDATHFASTSLSASAYIDRQIRYILRILQYICTCDIWIDRQAVRMSHGLKPFSKHFRQHRIQLVYLTRVSLILQNGWTAICYFCVLSIYISIKIF